MAINFLPIVMNLLANKNPKAGALMSMFNTAKTAEKKENNEVKLSVFKRGDKVVKIDTHPSVY